MSIAHSSDQAGALTDILKSHHRLHDRLEHEHMLMREAAAEALLGSVFAGAPTGLRDSTSVDPWRKVLHTSGHRLSDLDSVFEHESHFSQNEEEGFELAFGGKARVDALERRKQCYRDEYMRLSNLRNDLIAQMELSDDVKLVDDLRRDVDRFERMLKQIEMRISALVGGVDGDTQKVSRRLGSLYK